MPPGGLEQLGRLIASSHCSTDSRGGILSESHFPSPSRGSCHETSLALCRRLIALRFRRATDYLSRRIAGRAPDLSPLATMRSPLLATVFLTLVGGAAAPGATVYVDNIAGDDLLDGRAAVSDAGSGPVRTIRKALRVVEAGDRIVLANTGEPYREMIGLSDRRHCGTAMSPFVIDGQGAVL